MLEVENKKLFLSIVSSLLQGEGDNLAEPFILLEDEKELKPSKNIEVVTDVISLDVNNKKFITAAIESLNKFCIADEMLNAEIEQMHQKLYVQVVDLINELSSDFSISANWNLAKYLKAYEFSVQINSCDGMFEKLTTYIQLMAEFMQGKINCFVNLKSYFDSAELLELYKYAIYNKVAILLVESSTQNVTLEYERKLIIDNEFDEFTVNS